MRLTYPRLEDSIALIQSTDSSRNEFGSGFIIKRDRYATYWLTCAHVVIDVGGIDKTRVSTFPATLVGVNEKSLLTLKDSYDLVVLRVEGLYRKKPLKLIKPTEKQVKCSIIGHFQNYGTKQIFSKEIKGHLSLGRPNIISSGDYTRALEVEIDDAESYLQPGYSGSPVLIQRATKVIGVVDQRKGDGKKGIAISVEAARNIFRKIPELADLLREGTINSGVKLTNWLMQAVEKNLLKNASPKLQQALDWLSSTGEIAKLSGDYALENTPYLQQLTSNAYDEEVYREKFLDDFYWELERYLELLYASLLTDSYGLLNKPTIRPTFANIAYENAFLYIKQAIPDYIDDEVANKLKNYIDYLIPRIHLHD